mgnify:CR=1
MAEVGKEGARGGRTAKLAPWLHMVVCQCRLFAPAQRKRVCGSAIFGCRRASRSRLYRQVSLRDDGISQEAKGDVLEGPSKPGGAVANVSHRRALAAVSRLSSVQQAVHVPAGPIG